MKFKSIKDSTVNNATERLAMIISCKNIEHMSSIYYYWWNKILNTILFMTNTARAINAMKLRKQVITRVRRMVPNRTLNINGYILLCTIGPVNRSVHILLWAGMIRFVFYISLQGTFTRAWQKLGEQEDVDEVDALGSSISQNSASSSKPVSANSQAGKRKRQVLDFVELSGTSVNRKKTKKASESRAVEVDVGEVRMICFARCYLDADWCMQGF